MDSDTDSDSPFPYLACGHLWDGVEDWADMAVILEEGIDGPDGPQPAYSSGHYCRACRATLPGERLGSMHEANRWLRSVQQP
jgi:hypothetical protein